MINLRILLSAGVALLVFACGNQPAAEETTAQNDAAAETQSIPEATEASGTTTVTAVAVELDEAMIAKLAAADETDGTADQVVHKCGGCNLGMDGKTEFAIQVGEYEMHFCSAYCKKGFVEKPAEEIAGLPAATEGP